MIAALFVQSDGCYIGLHGVDPWPEPRDARCYPGPWPVIAHPPCQRWCGFARLNERRYGLLVGDDGGCFASALDSVRRWGGVLEHPAGSLAWPAFGLPRPRRGRGWTESAGAWVCEVAQSAYGHRARKRTWLYYVGPRPPELCWDQPKGTAQCGWFDRIKPTLGKREASATPAPFRDILISLARSANA